ncbi:universal stress protein [Pseudoduganella ginsengisoli]|uniref:Universal stress protein n=1 Tax=Pseudoduganella ginsengisoli TaxID=1462440 RepID=A0A6L6Q0Z3_9BURK|nr:universal stress protein [Pseudoduganella ginsengisoli]MTW03300.1 universal stress protein [Pseudoduganella ginsengisoli]
MAYRSILVHVDETPRVAERIRYAVELALQDDGHLLGVALTGISRVLYQNAILDEQDPNLALHLNFLRERANRALEQFAPLVQRLGLQSFEQRVVDDDPGAGLSLLARHADLVVIGQADPEHVATVAGTEFPAQVLTNSGRPVLVVPYAGLPRPAGAAHAPARRILVAWNGSKEAARAVREALPLLKRADHVFIAVFDPDYQKALHGESPGADLLKFLMRHGIDAEILVRQTERTGMLKRPSGTGEALLSLAADQACDLLVLGAYGHSRFRETLLGGVTRTVLEAMTLPVLMAH